MRVQVYLRIETTPNDIIELISLLGIEITDDSLFLDLWQATTATATASGETNATSGHVLTGIPQIDYIWDPNLPRELNGYNLSDYPFYNSIPEDIDFKCDGLHDGFYASVPHKCQVRRRTRRRGCIRNYSIKLTNESIDRLVILGDENW